MSNNQELKEKEQELELMQRDLREIKNKHEDMLFYIKKDKMAIDEILSLDCLSERERNSFEEQRYYVEKTYQSEQYEFDFFETDIRQKINNIEEKIELLKQEDTEEK